MIIKQGNELTLSTEKVSYTQNGKQKENIVGEEGSAWWENLQTNGKISNLTIEQIAHEQDVLDRFEEVKDLRVKNLGLLQEYVEFGTVPDENNELSNFILRKENAEMREQLDLLLGVEE
ncbi:MAG: hypothetical protein ACLFPS_09715 [Clostridia bacterium]